LWQNNWVLTILKRFAKEMTDIICLNFYFYSKLLKINSCTYCRICSFARWFQLCILGYSLRCERHGL